MGEALRRAFGLSLCLPQFLVDLVFIVNRLFQPLLIFFKYAHKFHPSFHTFVGAADPCGPLVWGSCMFRFVVPRGRLRAAEVCGPYEKIRKKFIQIT